LQIINFPNLTNPNIYILVVLVFLIYKVYKCFSRETKKFFFITQNSILLHYSSSREDSIVFLVFIKKQCGHKTERRK